MGLPQTLLDSARPRWSHRDPVEDGNPFPPGDPNAARWAEATATARARLRAHDARLAETADVTLDPARYRAQIVELAGVRFDTWAKRLLVVLDDEARRAEGCLWLDRYVDNWLAYAAETLPHVTFGTDLEDRLRASARYWSGPDRSESTAQSPTTPPIMGR